jgi:hypothetical protein
MLKLPGHRRYTYSQSNVSGPEVTTLSRAILDSRYKTPDNVSPVTACGYAAVCSSSRMSLRRLLASAGSIDVGRHIVSSRCVPTADLRAP